MIRTVLVYVHLTIVTASIWSDAALGQDRTPPGQADRIWAVMNANNQLSGAWAGTANFKNGKPWDVKLVIHYDKEAGEHVAVTFYHHIPFMPEPIANITKNADGIFQFTLLPDTPLATRYSGKVDGEKFSGTLVSPLKGLEGTFELYRVRDPLVE